MSTSLRLQLNSFFINCPEGDCLTADDAAEKFDVALSYAYRILKDMVSDGLLETTSIQSPKMHRMVVAYRSAKVMA